MSALSELSREKLYSMINQMNEENNSLKEKICLLKDENSLLKTELNEYRNESKKQKRQSFSERICDDLSEVLLQFLPFEAKLRFQCVSKQFQRTVFRRQNELFINMSAEEHEYYLNSKTRFPMRRVHNYYYIEDQSMHSFKTLLKKCTNITSIQLDGDYRGRNYNPDKFDEAFRLIIENCNNLNEINVHYYINDSNFEEFHRKFGSKIRHLPYYRELIHLNLFPNIEKFTIHQINDDSIISQLKLAKLKQLEIRFDQDQEHLLQTVIDTFPTLTHFNVVIRSKDENAIYKSLKNISNLKHLIHFKLHIQFEKNNKLFYDLWKQMVNNCKNLKSFGCRLKIDDQNTNIVVNRQPLGCHSPTHLDHPWHSHSFNGFFYSNY